MFLSDRLAETGTALAALDLALARDVMLLLCLFDLEWIKLLADALQGRGTADARFVGGAGRGALLVFGFLLLAGHAGGAERGLKTFQLRLGHRRGGWTWWWVGFGSGGGVEVGRVGFEVY